MGHPDRRLLRQDSRHVATRGFTLVEVLVALGITAVTLMAGLQATGSLSRNADRQTVSMLGQICAENELIALRLRRQLPDTGNRSVECNQAGRLLLVDVSVQPGQTVRAGERLAAIEAMKMENILFATQDCVVSEVLAKKGDSLAVDQVIIKFQ